MVSQCLQQSSRHALSAYGSYIAGVESFYWSRIQTPLYLLIFLIFDTIVNDLICSRNWRSDPSLEKNYTEFTTWMSVARPIDSVDHFFFFYMVRQGPFYHNDTFHSILFCLTVEVCIQYLWFAWNCASLAPHSHLLGLLQVNMLHYHNVLYHEVHLRLIWWACWFCRFDPLKVCKRSVFGVSWRPVGGFKEGQPFLLFGIVLENTPHECCDVSIKIV